MYFAGSWKTQPAKHVKDLDTDCKSSRELRNGPATGEERADRSCPLLQGARLREYQDSFVGSEAGWVWGDGNQKFSHTDSFSV